MTVRLWDSLVKSVGVGNAYLYSSAGWGNKANWYLVPYGDTDYIFKGDAIIDNDIYWIDFYGGVNQRPAMAGNINGIPQRVSEIYGKRLRSAYTVWNVWNNLADSLKINEYTQNKVSLTLTCGSYSNNYPNENVITYVSRANINSLEVIPETTDRYDVAGHASPNREVAAPANDGIGTDLIVDKKIYDYIANAEVVTIFPDANHNNMLVQDVTSDGTRSIYTLIPKAPGPDVKLVIAIYKTTDGIMRVGSLRNMVEKGQPNDRAYLGTINVKNVFWTLDINQYLTVGEKYTSWLTIGSSNAVPGVWRMTARMNVNGELKYFTENVSSGAFTFMAPVSGTLEVLTMYLYDRTTTTPASIKTVMDVYGEIPTIIPTPTPTPPPEEGMIRVYISTTGQIVTLDIESQYLPYVVVAENASAPWESMKAQAITARTIAYYKLLNPSGDNFNVYDDTRDQIYNPSLPILDIHRRSVSETVGVHLKYANVIILAFYVLGIGDYFQFVTFNEGKTGDDITQTTLGYTTDPPSLFPYNRGCMGQVQANDLAQNNGYTVDQILKYFYGADIIIIPPLPTPTPPPTPTPVPGSLIQNPGFESGTASWWVDPTANVTFSTASPGYEGNYTAKLNISNGANVQLLQPGISLEPDTSYRLTFAAYSTTGHDIAIRILKHVSPYTIYGLNTTFNLSTGWQVFTVDFTTSGFTSTVNDGRLQFWLDQFAAAGDIYYIDDVKLEIVPTIPQKVKYPITIESVPPGALIKVDGIAKTTSVYSVGGLNIIEQILRDM